MSTIDRLPTLDSVIRSVMDQAPEADPQASLDAVIAAIPAGMHEHYLREALRARFSAVVSVTRAGLGRPARSRKVEAIRDWWSEFLRERVCVAGEWKFLGDCTPADLRALSEARAAQARALQEVADRYLVLAELMERSCARTLSALDPKKGLQLLGVAA